MMRRTHVWKFYTGDFQRAFLKLRFETSDDRGKTYRYWAPIHPPGGWTPGVWRKPEGADSLLYNLPELLVHPRVELWWLEGERDADRVGEEGVLTTSHHGGAGKVSREQAQRLSKHRADIVLCADNDLPGAVDLVRRYDLLREWHPAKRLRIVAPPARYKDARDALDAGVELTEFRTLNLTRVRDAAGRACEADFHGGGYLEPLTPEELADAERKHWRFFGSAP